MTRIDWDQLEADHYATITALSLALSDVPEPYEPRPGQDVCKTEGC